MRYASHDATVDGLQLVVCLIISMNRESASLVQSAFGLGTRCIRHCNNDPCPFPCMRHARCKRKLSEAYGYMVGLPRYYLPPSSMLGPDTDRVPPKTAIGHMLIYFIHNHHVPPWLCRRSLQDKLRVTTTILAWVPMPRPRTQPNQVKQAMPALPSSKCDTTRYVGVYSCTRCLASLSPLRPYLCIPTTPLGCDQSPKAQGPTKQGGTFPISSDYVDDLIEGPILLCTV
ncbi:hypothetical protein LZ31DRAFT_324123 [Colletotrichum somersetense]|nr:hypothetical protein LZ31DRAFT_324123 [Colletotrichum somersetense]